MSELMTVTIAWPVDDIPLPVLDYSGQAVNTTIGSPMDLGYTYRRSRSKTTYTSVSVGWALKRSEWKAFQTFFEDDLGNGAARFSIALRYPKATDLSDWMVQFVGGYEMSTEDGSGIYIVQANLYLVLPVLLPDAAPEYGAVPFYVKSGGVEPDSQLITSEGYLFYTV